MLRPYSYLLAYWFNLWVIQVLLWKDKQTNFPLVSFGNPGAIWKVPAYLLKKQSICYCAGVGEDISFELGLYQYIRPSIHLFDPTPRAIKFIQNQKLPKKIRFSPWGLWSKNSRQKFFAPATKSFVSHSIVNLHQTKDFFTAECKKLSWIMKQFGDTELDLLKIDIEGAEYMVLQQLLQTKLRPKILAVEFDQPTPVMKTFAMIKQLMNAGYSLVDQTGWNFIFVYGEGKKA